MQTKDLIDISEYISSNPPDTLFYYTTLNGLQGILENKELWLSHMYFLNDRTEYQYGLDLFRNAINTYRGGFETMNSTKAFLSGLDSAMDFVEGKESPFILSLTRNDDLLSQWRGYTDNGIGVNIGFNKAFYDQANFKIFPCIYDQEKQKKLVHKIVTDSIFLFMAISRDMGLTDGDKDKESDINYDEAITAAGSLFIDRTILACSLIKNTGFKEEEEWRLLYFNKDKKVSFIPKKNFLKPIVKIPLTDIEQTIDTITIGPNPNKDLCEVSIRKLLNEIELEIKSIKHSMIPYRN